MPEEIERDQVQGIILTGWQHMPHAAFLFFRISGEQQGSDWIRGILPDILSARNWPKNPDGSKRKPTTALNIAFSYKGFEVLGLPQKALETFPIEFALGAAERSGILGDSGESAPEKWEIGGPQNKEIHGVLLMYATSDHRLQNLIDSQRQRVAQTHHGVVEVALERGRRFEDEKEHFGFRDGISQPAIQGMSKDADSQIEVSPGEFLLGYLDEYGMYSEGPAVPEAADPQHMLRSFPEDALDAFKDFGRNGSYLVYRKLEQDVAGFWQFMEANAKGDSEEMILLASKFFGRWPSGAPISLSPDSDDTALSEMNNFVFMESDPHGYRCPIGSHIRRANPRDSRINDTPAESLKTSSRHRLARRGVYYGTPLFDRDALDNGEAPIGLEDDGQPRGLHFFAINASIARQFEFLQQTWCNSATFNAEFDTTDPIVGCNTGSGVMTLQARPVRRRIRNVPEFVRVRGGAYLFLPGLSALHYLAKDAV